jgi:CRP/FNR family transcriptional regulator, anaerobic regulatory protein
LAKFDRDIDDFFYNKVNKETYLSCGAGYVDVFEKVDANKYIPGGKVSTHSGARTSLLVPELNQLIVASGVVRIYSVNEAGEEVTWYFFRENQFIVDLESYYSRKPSTYPLQAAVDTLLNCVKREDWEKLIEKIPQLFILTKSLSEALLLNKLKDHDFLNFGTATDKYKEFIKRYPDLALYVPQQYIASYLKITPQSLSRIRKMIAS